VKESLAQAQRMRNAVNEIKEVLIQMYAYCGFPRSLNGINIFMSVLEERKKKGINKAVMMFGEKREIQK
jgi:hypothetical protein